MEWAIYSFASSEITVSHVMHRNFWWYNNMLWLEDLPAHIGVVVGVAGCDDINNAHTIFEYVRMCRELRRRTVLLSASSVKIKSSTSFDNISGSMKKRESFGRLSIVATPSSLPVPVSPRCGNGGGIGALRREIEGVLWPDYRHGQILLGGKHLQALIDLVNRNEKGYC